MHNDASHEPLNANINITGSTPLAFIGILVVWILWACDVIDISAWQAIAASVVLFLSAKMSVNITMTGRRHMALGNWEPRDRGHELSVDDVDNSGYLYWARTEPVDNGAWRWEAWAEDEWNVPTGNAGGTTATESEAKAAAERWMRPARHLTAVPNPDSSSDSSATERNSQ